MPREKLIILVITVSYMSFLDLNACLICVLKELKYIIKKGKQ